MEPYRYLPLRPEIHEIRLLSITSAPPDSTDTPQSELSQPWHLDLIQTSLDSLATPSFSALSYVWGDPTDKKPIAIDGHTLPITKNLHSALTRLHRQNFTGHIWIDALCINQSDTLEKNSQVPLMARIYSQAEQVLVWLGPEPDDGALRAVQQLGLLGRKHVKDVPGGGKAQVARLVSAIREHSFTGPESASQDGFDFEAILRFFRQRAWWRRVWIIQEVVLARRQVVVLCTEDVGVSAPWEDVRECLSVFEWMVLNPSTAPEHRRLYEILGEVYPNVMHLGLVSDMYKGSLAESGVSESRGGVGMPLVDTIIFTSFGTGSEGSIQATDLRDRIYGLLGITRREDRQRIVVDYSPETTLNKVLFMVAKVLLERHGPDVLCYCRETSLHSQGLPSWVPDWTVGKIPSIGDVSLSGDGTRQPYNATNGAAWSEWASRSRIRDSIYEDPVVTLPGLVIGRISGVGHEFKTLPFAPNFLADCRAWLRELQDMVEQAFDILERDESLERPITKDEAIANLWRVPLVDCAFTQRPNPQEVTVCKHGFAVLTGQHPPPDDLDEEAEANWAVSESWGYRLPWRIYERCAFVDMNGRPGLGPKSMESGDSIAVFAGGHVPFIIRKAGEGSYRLVGSAYVYGLMDGEALYGGPSFGDINIVK